MPDEWQCRLKPGNAAYIAAEAAENVPLMNISSAIQRLPVVNGVSHMTAVEWVMDPGETETEGTETIAEIAARITGQPMSDENGEDPNEEPNDVEPKPVSLREAQTSSLVLSQFVGDNIGTFSEEEYRMVLQFVEKIQTLPA